MKLGVVIIFLILLAVPVFGGLEHFENQVVKTPYGYKELQSDGSLRDLTPIGKKPLPSLAKSSRSSRISTQGFEQKDYVVQLFNAHYEKSVQNPTEVLFRTYLQKVGASVISEHSGGYYIIRASQSIGNSLPSLPYVVSSEAVKDTFSVFMSVATPTIYTDFFWNNSLAGINGTRNVSISIVDTGVNYTHPALFNNSNNAQRSFSFYDFTATRGTSKENIDINTHGTHVAGSAFSSDATYAGVAKGVERVVVAKGLYDVGGVPGGSDASGTEPSLMSSMEWSVDGVNITAVDVVSNSWGCANSNLGCESDGTSLLTRFTDALTHNFQKVIVFAAGNSGPGAQTISIPADAYNVITVANGNDQNTITRTDDTIGTSSSRGSADDGRKKPDVTAPGTSILSTNSFWQSGSLFSSKTGTSMAAPIVSGAALLLSQAGLNHLEIKGVIINSAEDKGTFGWDSAWGWGFIDLSTAYEQINKTQMLYLQPNQSVYFLANSTDNLTATLVWERVAPYAAGTAPPISSVSELTDVDLYIYHTNGTLLAKSISILDNVERTQANDTNQYVIRVHVYDSVFNHTEPNETIVLVASTNTTQVQLGTLQSQVTGVANSSSLLTSCIFSHNGTVHIGYTNITVNASSNGQITNVTTTSVVINKSSITKNVSFQAPSSGYFNVTCSGSVSSFGTSQSVRNQTTNVLITAVTPVISQVQTNQSVLSINDTANVSFTTTRISKITSAFVNNVSATCSVSSFVALCYAVVTVTNETVLVNITDITGNLVSKNATLFTVDEIAPVINNVSVNTVVQYGSVQEVIVNATDQMSVSTVTTNDDAMVLRLGLYYANVTVTQTNLTVIATDSVNLTITKIFNITFDTTAPTTLINTSGGNSTWTNQSVQMNLSALDTHSISSLEYRVGDNNWQTYSTPITFANTLSNNTVYYRATDVAQNTDESKFVRILIDKTAPAITNISLTQLTRANTTLPITVFISDPKSGVLIANITINGTTTQLTKANGVFSGTLVSPAEIGSYNTTILAQDAAGNVAFSTVLIRVSSAAVIQFNPANNSVISSQKQINITSVGVNITAVNTTNNTLSNATFAYVFLNASQSFIVNLSNGSSAIYRYTVDTTAPKITISNISNQSTINGTVFFQINTSDTFSSVSWVAVVASDSVLLNTTSADFTAELDTYLFNDTTINFSVVAADVFANQKILMYTLNINNRVILTQSVSNQQVDLSQTHIGRYVPTIQGLNSSSVSIISESLATSARRFVNTTAKELLYLDINATTANRSTIFVKLLQSLITNRSFVKFKANHGSGFVNETNATFVRTENGRHIFSFTTTEFSEFVVYESYPACTVGSAITNACVCSSSVYSSGFCCSGARQLVACGSGGDGSGGGGSGSGSSSGTSVGTASTSIDSSSVSGVNHTVTTDVVLTINNSDIIIIGTKHIFVDSINLQGAYLVIDGKSVFVVNGQRLPVTTASLMYSSGQVTVVFPTASKNDSESKPIFTTLENESTLPEKPKPQPFDINKLMALFIINICIILAIIFVVTRSK
ncbi:MAG: hypothetical protein ACI8Y7_000140 [Candidatus Woesearchaeota archaeon]|jgi:hypothetical protein